MLANSLPAHLAAMLPRLTLRKGVGNVICAGAIPRNLRGISVHISHQEQTLTSLLLLDTVLASLALPNYVYYLECRI